MENSDNTSRRTFLGQASTCLALGTALSTTAASYSRIIGANDRISLGHIGIGDRGRELDGMVARLKDKCNLEMTAVCDLWTANRDRAAANAERVYGRRPRTFQNMEELLALPDVDAVVVATCVAAYGDDYDAELAVAAVDDADHGVLLLV